MKIIFRLAVLLPLVLLCAGWSHGRGPHTFYVSNSGNDSNSGLTAATAWATLTKVNSSTYNSGDTIALDSFSSFSGGISLNQSNVPAFITIASTSATQSTVNSGNSTSCVIILNIPGATVHNLNCVGGGNFTNTVTGIDIRNTLGSATVIITGPIVSNNTVSGYGFDCILVIGANAGSGLFNAIITGNNTHDCTGNHVSGTTNDNSACILTGAEQAEGNPSFVKTIFQNPIITNNIMANCTGTTGGVNPSGNGLAVADGTLGTVSGNYIHDIGINNSVCPGPAGLILYQEDQVTVSSNEVANVYIGGGCDGEGIDFDHHVSNSIAEYNYVHCIANGAFTTFGVAGGLGGNTGNVWRFNIVDRSGCPGTSGGGIGANLDDGNNGNGVTFYNNTMSCCGIQVSSNVGSTEIIANNIFNANGAISITSVSGTPTINITGNDYTGPSFNIGVLGTNYTSLAALQTAGYEKVAGNPVGTTANPNLNGTGFGPCLGYAPPCPNAYQLSSATPAGKGNGLNLNSLYGFPSNLGGQDFYGNAVTNTTLPIGAAANK